MVTLHYLSKQMVFDEIDLESNQSLKNNEKIAKLSNDFQIHFIRKLIFFLFDDIRIEIVRYLEVMSEQ